MKIPPNHTSEVIRHGFETELLVRFSGGFGKRRGRGVERTIDALSEAQRSDLGSRISEEMEKRVRAVAALEFRHYERIRVRLKARAA
jgi:hypothetical protein